MCAIIRFALHIGIPMSPSITQSSSNPVEKTIFTMTCDADSTSTYPSNLPTDQRPIMEYRWQRDNTDLPTDGRHTVSGTAGNTLTIDKVQRDDHQKLYTCRAQETGSRESSSKDITVKVLCEYFVKI